MSQRTGKKSAGKAGQSGSALLRQLTENPAIAGLKQRWQALAGREQALLATIGTLLVLALLWWWLLQPAISNWQQARAAKAQWQTNMQRVQAAGKQAAALRDMKSMSSEAVKNAISDSLKLLAGTAQVSWQANTARINLQNTRPDALAQWLSAVRLDALSIPDSSSLTLAEKGWSGTIVLRLPSEP